MTEADRDELMKGMANLEKKMQEPERGQTTLETLRNDVAKLTDAIYMILDHLEPEE